MYKKEPPQKVQYNALIRKSVQGYSFNLAFQSVPQNDKDMYALDLICQMLGGGASSRLYKRLVNNRQIATSAYCSHFNMQDHGLFNIHVSLKPDLSMDEALKIVYNQVYMLRNYLVTEDELEKAKILSIKSIVDSLKTIDGKARALATSEITTGSYENLLMDISKYQKVSITEIKEVAAKYLKQYQRSVVVLEPKNE